MNDDALDDALERLAGTAPEFGRGLSNHGPMAAEALVQLGRSDAVAAFVDRYRRRLEPAPVAGRPVRNDEWESALGSTVRWPDWAARFERDVAEGSPAEVLALWVPRLLPGSIAAAMHGVIRTAHAVRMVSSADTPPRRRELAEALAYWAARYEELPGPPVPIGRLTVAEALAEVPYLPEEVPAGHLIGDRVRHVAEVADEFEQAVASLAPQPDLVAALVELARGGARAYLANADLGDPVALVHAVTGPMAAELLLPVLGSDDRPAAVDYAWQAVAAIHVAYAPRRGSPPVGDVPPLEDVVAAAVESGDEHAIKLVEAARRAHRRTADPTLLAAAWDAARRLG